MHPGLKVTLNIVIISASLLAISSLLLEYGFYFGVGAKALLHKLDILIAGIFLTELFLKLILARDRKLFLKSNRPDFIIAIVFLVLLLVLRGFSALPGFIHGLKRLGMFPLGFAYVVVCQIYIAASLFLKATYLNRLIAHLRLSPPWIVILTFVCIIVLGTLLLSLPKSTAPGKETTLLSALFTATSATCVTGLIVVDTGSHFSLMGQIIILCLIQIGGLGLMTFTSFFALVLGRGIGIKDRVVLRDIFDYTNPGMITRLVLSILGITFTIEAIGALLLYSQFLPQIKDSSFCIYSAIFHSISAFCNAGFSLYQDSFIGYGAHLGINLIMGILIILGGLGFMVLINLLHWRPSRFKRKGKSLTVQTKLVLITSSLLILMGALFLLIGEGDEVLKGLSLKEKLLGAFFQSITARTAGFNTLNIANLTNFSAFLLIILMFIGASPGSTGGGIKTSTFATLLLTVRSMARRKSRVEVFKRTIPRMVTYQALCVGILALGWISISTLFLSLTEKAPFINILFEDLSAFGTVGLSRGITRNLTSAGKIIIILTMLIGRIGPLTLALAIGGRRVSEPYEYPEEKIMIG